MGRPPKVFPSHSIHLKIPEDLYARLRLSLFSESDQWTPRGRIQDFFIQRMNEYFTGRCSREFTPSTRQEAYLGLETIFAISSKKETDQREALRAIAKWSRIYADKLLEEIQKEEGK